MTGALPRLPEVPSPAANSAPPAAGFDAARFDVAAQAEGSAASWAWGAPRRIARAATGFSHYVRCALTGDSVQEVAPPAASLWPSPPPFGWRPGPPPRGGRRRQRWARFWAAALMANLAVLACSHLALGMARCCPAACRSGRPLSAAQAAAGAHFLRLSKLMCRPPLGIGARGRIKLVALAEYAWAAGAAPVGRPLPPPPALTLAAFKANRVKYMKTDSHFDPTPWLSMRSAAAYLEPRLLELRHPREPPPRVRPMQERQELLNFCRDLDRHGKLYLAAPVECPRSQRMPLLAVPKSDTQDRLVGDRRARNAWEAHVGGDARWLAGGADLCELVVPEHHCIRIWSDDVQDMYPAFDAAAARAVTNAIAVELPSRAFAGTRALSRRPGLEQEPFLVPCISGMISGDLNAVDFAQDAHGAVLHGAGSYQPRHRVLGGRPLPRGPHLETLCIDDHVGIAIQPLPAPLPLPSMADSFARAGRAYAGVGLAVHPEKAQRHASQATVIGAEILGNDGLIGAERQRRALLAVISMHIAARRQSSGACLRKLISTWQHALLYRRPVMCVLFALYRELPALRQDKVVAPLSAAAASELQLLGCLAPTLVTNVRAPCLERLVASDASEERLGAAAAPVSQLLAQELWRQRDRRGCCTALASRTLLAVQQKTGLVDPLELVEEVYGPPGPERPWREAFDFLELCTGSTAPLSRAMAREGLVVGPHIDITLASAWDIRESRTIEWILWMVRRGRIWYFHGGPPCTTFSVARCPRLRSRAAPLGLDPRERRTAEGNLLLLRCLAVLWAIRRSSPWHGSFEHPASAYSWHLPLLRALFVDPEGRKSEHPISMVELDMCQFGAPYRKSTRLGRVRAGWLAALGRRCAGGHRHEQLQGGRTTAAACYPAELCACWAAAAAAACRQEAALFTELQAADPPEARPGALERLWLNDLTMHLPWRTQSSARAAPAHINVLETRAALRAALEATPLTGVRVPMLVDSMVAKGCLAKGRSSAKLLNDEMRKHVGALLGRDLYMGLAFCPTRLNPGDPPSRGRSLPPARKRPPPWLAEAAKGDYATLDEWAAVPLQRRAAGEWLRFVLLLRPSLLRALGDYCYVPPPVKCDPRWPSPFAQRCWALLLLAAALPRGAWAPRPIAGREGRPLVDLQRERALTHETLRRRSICLSAFESWLARSAGTALAKLLPAGPRVVARLLAAYGQALFDGGAAISQFRDTILAVQDADRSLRRQLQPAWDVVLAWQVVTPSVNRCPTPLPVLRAMAALAYVWGWPDIALLLLLMFTCMMRPKEALRLTVGGLVLPSQLLAPGPPAFVQVAEPKMRRLSARREHVRLDDVGIVRFLEAEAAVHGADERLFAGTAAQFRACHDYLVAFFGIACAEGRGPDPRFPQRRRGHLLLSGLAEPRPHAVARPLGPAAHHGDLSPGGAGGLGAAAPRAAAARARPGYRCRAARTARRQSCHLPATRGSGCGAQRALAAARCR